MSNTRYGMFSKRGDNLINKRLMKLSREGIKSPKNCGDFKWFDKHFNDIRENNNEVNDTAVRENIIKELERLNNE